MEAQQQFEPQVNENLVMQLWAKYFPYWPIFLLLIGFGIGGAFLYLNYKLPVYESTATLLIKDEKKGIEDSKMMESLNMLSGKKIIENEIEVIKSKAILNQVVQDLQLYAPVFKEGKWRDVPAYNESPVKIEVKDPKSLVEVKKIEFSYSPDTKMVNLKSQNYPLDKWVSTQYGTFKFSENKEALLTKGLFYFALINPKRVTQTLLKNLEVTSSAKLSSVITLSLKDVVPQRSEDILTALIQAYDKGSLTDKNVLAQNTLSFLDERLRYVSKDMDSIERKLQQYKAHKGAIDISSQGKLFLQNVSDNDQKLSDVNMKLAVLKQVEEYVSSNDGRGNLAPSTLGIEDKLLTSLLEKLYDIELKYEKIRRTTGENNPELLSLADQIQKIKPGILENIHSQQAGLEANKKALFSTNNSYTSSLQSLPQQERDLVEISREQNIKSSVYSFLLQKREETALSNSSTVSDTRVVDKPESTLEPVSLDGRFIYAIAVILALGLGITLIAARELFSRSILFRREIEAISPFPVIGEITQDKTKSPLVIAEGKASFIAEEFRMLRTSLHYLGMGSPGKNILVTSTIPGEGKSFVAVNLAMSLAMGGKKVILVEFDLNNPTLATKLGIENGKGVADYLCGDVHADEVIRSTPNNDNLFILTAGNLTKDPAELMLLNRTAELLQNLKNKFDYVVVDSAPVGILSHGYILSRHCDATIYVVRHGHTPKKMLERLEYNNKINELKNLAIVFNGIRSRGFGKNSYSYGHDYGYVYSQYRVNEKSK